MKPYYSDDALDDLRYALKIAEQGGYSPGHCGECDAGTRRMVDDPDDWQPAHEPGCRVGELLDRPVRGVE